MSVRQATEGSGIFAQFRAAMAEDRRELDQLQRASADESWYERVGIGALQIVEGIGTAAADLASGSAEISLQFMQKAGNAYTRSGATIQLITGAGIAVAEGIYDGRITPSSVGTAVGGFFVQSAKNVWHSPAEMAKGNIAQGTYRLTDGVTAIAPAAVGIYGAGRSLLASLEKTAIGAAGNFGGGLVTATGPSLAGGATVAATAAIGSPNLGGGLFATLTSISARRAARWLEAGTQGAGPGKMPTFRSIGSLAREIGGQLETSVDKVQRLLIGNNDIVQAMREGGHLMITQTNQGSCAVSFRVVRGSGRSPLDFRVVGRNTPKLTAEQSPRVSNSEAWAQPPRPPRQTH